MDLLSFLDTSPTSFHAVKRLIEDSGALPFEGKIEAKTPYFVENEGALILFKTPKNPKRATIAAAHTDSPSLKLKPNPVEVRDNLFTLSSDVYGTPLLRSWFNRDLSIAGKILTKQGPKLIHLTDLALTIPELAPHLGDNGDELDVQEHLRAIVGFYDKILEGKLLETLTQESEILAHDLFLVPCEKSSKLGLNKAFIASYRLDNLASCHAIAHAFKSSNPSELAMAVFWDHEEIGSETPYGALSPFFLDTLEQITLSLNMTREGFLNLKKASRTYSIDLAHASHPNYPEKMEPNHAPLLGKGPALKWSATRRYATDALSAAPLPRLQRFVLRAGLKGGSTIGPLHAAQTGIPTADLGIPELSMHSIRELIAEKDHLEMISLLKGIYDS